MAQRPKTIYANRVNLSGLYSKEPICCKREREGGSWWDSSGYFDVDELGEHVREDEDSVTCITFSSKSKKEVELWTQGALAVMRLLSGWSK